MVSAAVVPALTCAGATPPMLTCAVAVAGGLGEPVGGGDVGEPVGGGAVGVPGCGVAVGAAVPVPVGAGEAVAVTGSVPVGEGSGVGVIKMGLPNSLHPRSGAEPVKPVRGVGGTASPLAAAY